MKNYKNNPRKITDIQLQELEAFLRELGDLSGIVHDLNSDQVIGGNQRSKVFDINNCEIVIEHRHKKADSQGTVAVGYVMWEGKRYSYRAVRWTKKQCNKANIVANKAGGDWDDDLLKKYLKSDELIQWGFNDDELITIFDTQENKKIDAKPRFDEADKLLKHWGVKAGDLWSLGEHRLICGDSAQVATVNCLMASQGKDITLGSLFSTDPPYMVDYDGTARPGGGKDWSDKYKESTIKDKGQFLLNVFNTWKSFQKPNAAWFIWHASSTASIFEKALQDCGILVHQQIIWVKPVFILGFSTYYYQHEPCFFGWPQSKKPYVRKRFFDGKESTVWQGLSDDALKQEVIAELHGGSSIWHIDWQGKKRPVKNNHPTEKPVEIFARPIRNHTKHGDICLEPFSGSGSQILAGEQEGRRVYACELEPAFVAVGLQRFEDATGIKPKRLERG